MGKIRFKKIGYFLLAVIFLLGLIPSTSHAKEEIKRSEKKYEVNINDSQRVFIGNETPIEYKVGAKYFLSYTVAEIESNETTQSGMIITTDKEEAYPYTKGGMKYDKYSLLMEEGYTYFFRFEIKETGLECIAAKAKGDSSEYIKLPHVAGDITCKGKYFGIWTAETGKITGKLTNVRCYDASGKDLGVYGNESQGLVVLPEGGLQGIDSVAHSYSFSLKDANHVSISNLRSTTSDVLYMEYTIKNVKYKDVTQSGVVMTNSPTAVYPYGSSGFMKYSPHEKPEECLLIEEGASYLYRIIRNEEDFDVLVKRTVNGKVSYFSFPHVYGTYDAKCGYYTVWIGEHAGLTADFVDVKAYDKDGNNLAIQTNKGVEIKHYGNLEDYSECEAVYYCKELDAYISLDDDCNASKRTGEEPATVGQYYIRETTLTLEIGKKKEEFQYVYNWLVDKDGNKYLRLRDQKVTIMSRPIDGEVIEVVSVTAKDGFKLSEPEAPKGQNGTFKGWVLGDGTTYDFDAVVLESFTLYADWDNNTTFTAITNVNGPISPKLVVVIAGSGLLIIATILFLHVTKKKPIGQSKKGKKTKKVKKNKKKSTTSRKLFLIFCISLPLLNFLIFYIYPNFSSLTMAFHNASGVWGFDNFARFWRELVRPNSDLQFALKNTLLTFAILFLTFPLKVLVSYFIYKKVPGHKFFRIIFFLPTIIMPLAVAIIFKRMVGVNGFLAQTVQDWMNLDYVPELLADTRFANMTVLLHMVWLSFPGDLIIWGGTFSRIPEDMLESARIDGVSWWTEFTKIIVPLVWPTVALQMLLLICGIFGSSGQVWLLTEGQYGTMTMTSWLYKMLYEQSGSNYTSNVYNYLSAVGFIVTTIAITLSMLTRKYTSKAFKDVEF